MAFYRLQSLFISMKIYNVVMDVAMRLLVPAKSVMLRVVVTLFITIRFPLNNSNVIWYEKSHFFTLVENFLILPRNIDFTFNIMVYLIINMALLLIYTKYHKMQA